MDIQGRVLCAQYHQLYHHYQLIHQQRMLQGNRLRFISLIKCKIELHILQITLPMEGQTICRRGIVSSHKVRYVSHLANSRSSNNSFVTICCAVFVAKILLCPDIRGTLSVFWSA